MHNVTLVTGAHRSDTMSFYVMLCSPQMQAPSVSRQHYYSIIHLYAVPYTSMTYLFYIYFYFG